jgi:hypothetical protein
MGLSAGLRQHGPGILQCQVCRRQERDLATNTVWTRAHELATSKPTARISARALLRVTGPGFIR